MNDLLNLDGFLGINKATDRRVYLLLDRYKVALSKGFLLAVGQSPRAITMLRGRPTYHIRVILKGRVIREGSGTSYLDAVEAAVTYMESLY